MVEKPKRVLVVGGGPAGLEAARVAALRGHRVTLVERENELGGQVAIAASVPRRQDFGNIVRYLKGQVERLAVDVRLGAQATAEMVLNQGADAVIVATGSRHSRSGYSPGFPDVWQVPGSDQPFVLTVREALLNLDLVGKKVVVLDDSGHHEGASTMEYLAESGRELVILTRFLSLAPDLSNTSDISFVLPRLLEYDVAIHPSSWVRGIEAGAVVAFNKHSGREWRIEGVDTVIVVTQKVADDALYRQLVGRVPDLRRVGDCVAPRKVDMAVYEGHVAARAL